ncbi:hypothetical protein [Geodermatophilus sp. DSM 45219]|uniref:hypothetical protein n=1 Tax=Geodermatophilus sp. DSM 45219 TaxID=1881103 RepID=UPI000880E6E7|nr:hypothetical protein [Geodermatophilus sp. DSM 45219]SDN41991.1 hypothetical protein SAMN05428965_0318 [Geodermatophilus sp. DSM 45219]
MDKVVKQIMKALGNQGSEVVEAKSGRLMVNREGQYVGTLAARYKSGRGLATGLAPPRQAGFTWPP